MTALTKHCDYVLVAEFDIDKGASLTYQYPQKCGTEENVLAELMLPDGAHKREEDWTIFFLNQKVPKRREQEEDLGSLRAPEANRIAAKKNLENFNTKTLDAYFYEYNSDEDSWKMVGSNKKKVRLERSAVVVLDGSNVILEVERDPDLQFQQMEPLYDCLISQEKAYGFRFGNENDEKTFLDHLDFLALPLDDVRVQLTPTSSHSSFFKDTISAFTSLQDGESISNVQRTSSSDGNDEKPLVYVLNLVRTKQIPGVRRGARTKAIAICTRHPFLHVFKPLLLLALDKYFKEPSIEVPEGLYNAVNSMDLSKMAQLTNWEKRILRSSESKGTGVSGGKDQKFFETKVNYLGIPIPMRITLAMFPDEVGDYSLIKLINIFNSPVKSAGGENGVMTIFNGLLTQKRIIFVGYDKPSGLVADYVLAAVGMFSPVLRGFAERAFPYTNLTSVDTVLQFPGFVAGVTNPTFEHHTNWWDILCNIETGKILVSTPVNPSEPEKYLSRDSDFMADVLFSIQSHHGEESVRMKFVEYIQRIADLAFGDAEFVDEVARKKELTINQARIDNWRKTISYSYYEQDRRELLSQRAIHDADVSRLINKLRIRKDLAVPEVADVVEQFVRAVETEEQLIEFLAYLPENQLGLFPICIPLFHPSEAVRRKATELLSRIEKTKAGVKYFMNLNAFLLVAYKRLKNEFGIAPEDY